MAGMKKVPEIRFKGFSDDWAYSCLRDLAEFNPKAELPEVFEYVDLESVIGTQMLSHRELTKNSAPSRAQRLAKQGDLFYQTVRPYQRNNYLFNLPDENFVFSTGYAQLRPHGSGGFLLTLVQNNQFVKTVLDNCTGTSYPAINSNSLAEIKVAYPLNNEQSQIGSYFQHLDMLISLHQAKVNKLTNVKKAMLEKMFPKQGADVPEIRFKGFAGAWEEKELGVITNTTIGEFVIKTRQNPNSPYPVFNGGKSYTGFYDEYNNEGNKVIISARGANAGYVNFTKNRFWAGNSCYSVEILDKAQFSIEFFYHYIKYNQNRFIENQQAANIPSVSKSDVEKFVISHPQFKEQVVIAKYFQNLDKTITLHQTELEKLNNLKKAGLEKMFV